MPLTGKEMFDDYHKIIQLQNQFYKNLDIRLINFQPELESQEYYAHSGLLNDHRIQWRIAKKTPKKVGYFVTTWKRNAEHLTTPYDVEDEVEFFVINVKDRDQIGQFIFPKKILISKNIISTSSTEGKRGIRVYTPWDLTDNRQAHITQSWQMLYFFDFNKPHQENHSRIQEILQL
ncbi:MAG: hypothetical protein FJ161_02080 [Gammaproteobacteria bacterium]|nr:hypothetical protein [Gammaproteobacteria bacterium]